MKFLKVAFKIFLLAVLVAYVVIVGGMALDTMNQSTNNLTQTLRR